jgi:Xaa-Pro aminopeptidase
VTPAKLPFSRIEFEQRRLRVQQAMTEHGIDLLYVTSPVNMLYLTGYEAIWYPERLPVGVAVQRTNAEVVVFDWSRHEGYVRSAVLCDDFVLFDYGTAAGVVAAEFVARGWTGIVGLERNSINPSGAVLADLAAKLADTGVPTISGDWIVDQVRLYKSEVELACIRQAAAIADRAMLRLRGTLKPGMTEVEVSTQLSHLLAQEGSELGAMPVLVNSGPTAWMDVHAFPSSRRLQAGDVVNIDCCASVKRYHANLGRSFVLGPADTKARRIISASAGCLDVLCRASELNGDPAPAAQAAEAYVRERVASENIWWIGGYSLGQCLPPSWVGHTYLANDGPQKCFLKPGYVSNFENVFIDAEEGFEAGCIDTLIMTETGLECLSTIPRELLEVTI